MDGMSMSVLDVGVLVPCSGRLFLLQLLHANSSSFPSLLLSMRKQRLLSFSWAQSISWLEE